MSKLDNYYSDPENQTMSKLQSLEEAIRTLYRQREQIDYHGDRVLQRDTESGWEDEARMGWSADRKWILGQLWMVNLDQHFPDGHELDTEAAMAMHADVKAGAGCDSGSAARAFLLKAHEAIVLEHARVLIKLARILHPRDGLGAELAEEEKMIEDAAEHGIDGRLERVRAGELADEMDEMDAQQEAAEERRNDYREEEG